MKQNLKRRTSEPVYWLNEFGRLALYLLCAGNMALQLPGNKYLKGMSYGIKAN